MQCSLFFYSVSRIGKYAVLFVLIYITQKSEYAKITARMQCSLLSNTVSRTEDEAVLSVLLFSIPLFFYKYQELERKKCSLSLIEYTVQNWRVCSALSFSVQYLELKRQQYFLFSYQVSRTGEEPVLSVLLQSIYSKNREQAVLSVRLHGIWIQYQELEIMQYPLFFYQYLEL